MSSRLSPAASAGCIVLTAITATAIGKAAWRNTDQAEVQAIKAREDRWKFARALTVSQLREESEGIPPKFSFTRDGVSVAPEFLRLRGFIQEQKAEGKTDEQGNIKLTKVTYKFADSLADLESPKGKPLVVEWNNYENPAVIANPRFAKDAPVYVELIVPLSRAGFGDKETKDRIGELRVSPYVIEIKPEHLEVLANPER